MHDTNAIEPLMEELEILQEQQIIVSLRLDRQLNGTTAL